MDDAVDIMQMRSKILGRGVDVMRLTDYRERLGICFGDVEKLQCLKSNLLTFFEVMPFDKTYLLSKPVMVRYCMNTGAYYYNGYSESDLVQSIYRETKGLSEVVFRWIAYCDALRRPENDVADKVIKYLVIQLEQFNIPFELFTDADGTYIFPKGAAELDIALVDDVLVWIQEYPKAKIEYEKALRLYADSPDPRLVADQLRISLETFMDEFFNTKKNLDKCITLIFGPYLKEMGIPSVIQDEVSKLVALYRLYNDEYVKHQNKADMRLTEFLLYQTGAVIRLLITLKQDEAKLEKR